MNNLTPSLFLMMQNSSAAWRSASTPTPKSTMSSGVARELYADDARTAHHAGEARRNLEDTVTLSPAASQLTK